VSPTGLSAAIELMTYKKSRSTRVALNNHTIFYYALFVHLPSCLASKYLGNKHMYVWKPFLSVKYIVTEEGIVFPINETKCNATGS
jgi:hypothetical protein